ncbi:MAG: hypothetical protein EBX35_03645, partial [Planctomycetia bacterium]|nr:hypothetical protein [Planctomycetia bacterium]
MVAMALAGLPSQANQVVTLPEEPSDRNESDPPRVDFDPATMLAQIGDPAVETVDEMTAGASPGSGRAVSPDDESFARQLGRRFGNIQDPAIETVDEQTAGGNDHSGEKEWYEKINIRGYTQFRINSTLWYDPDGAGPYHPNDKSVGPNNNFYIRRCRLIFSGDISDHLYIYIQPDFASGLSGVSDPGAINY